MVSYKWICKIKYVADISNLWLEFSLIKRESILKRHFLQEARYTSFRTMMVVASMMKYRKSFLNGMIGEKFYIE